MKAFTAVVRGEGTFGEFVEPNKKPRAQKKELPAQNEPMKKRQSQSRDAFNDIWKPAVIEGIAGTPAGRTKEEYADIMVRKLRSDSKSDQPLLFRREDEHHKDGSGSRIVAKPLINGKKYRSYKFNSKSGPTLEALVEAFKENDPDFKEEWGSDPDYVEVEKEKEKAPKRPRKEKDASGSGSGSSGQNKNKNKEETKTKKNKKNEKNKKKKTESPSDSVSGDTAGNGNGNVNSSDDDIPSDVLNGVSTSSDTDTSSDE
jgi:hypothetical protein